MQMDAVCRYLEWWAEVPGGYLRLHTYRQVMSELQSEEEGWRGRGKTKKGVVAPPPPSFR